MVSAVKYSWQQTVLDAFGASAESLPLKINEAQRAIAARQQEPKQPDIFERIAITDALHSLKSLIGETRSRSARQRMHFHILWAGGVLDWEPFDSHDGAEAAAKELARMNETYVIEKYGIDCPRCAEMSRPFSAKTGA